MIKNILIITGFSLALGLASTATAGSWNACNPCSMKANPCNPCAMEKQDKMNPCQMKMKNPCHMNPCDADGDAKKKIRSDKFQSFQQAATAGKKLWEDETLGKSGLACLSCHAGYENLNLGKRQNYPHYVAMPDDVVTLDQMINFCMINPMEGEQLDANSKDMTAMAAYFRAYRMQYLKEQRK
ncbi:MAG: hypothetical protein Q9M19_06045 [Mariprofundaceae bacterium]|nr:hypothetical protein [Mariprofundaceae bacterium]